MSSSMTFQPQCDLTHRNTLGFPSVCQWYCEPTTETEIEEALAFAEDHGLDISILGGGSNILIQPDVQGLVICPKLMTLSQEESEGLVKVTAGAGIIWHDLVAWSIDQGLSGLETLGLIPGHVGAAPIQNIGAYGVEIKDRLLSLRAYDRVEKHWRTLTASECNFGYRDSLFKRSPGRFLVSSITLELKRSEKAQPIRYAALAQSIPDDQPSSRAVFEAVCALRESKLPNPSRIGNAGSFFKNPVISQEQWTELNSQYPDLVSFDAEEGCKKLAAGWLIDRLGWKGKAKGAVGVYPKQALVLTHQGGGQLSDLLALAEDIQSSVREHFGITLEIEPQMFPQHS